MQDVDFSGNATVSQIAERLKNSARVDIVYGEERKIGDKTIIPIAATLMVIQGVAETVRAYLALRTGVWPPRLHDVEETETVLAKQAEV